MTRARAGAEREADGELTAACRPARQEQVGNVGARDQQHERDRAQQRKQARLDVANDPLVQRRQHEADLLVGLWKSGLELGRQGGGGGLRAALRQIRLATAPRRAA